MAQGLIPLEKTQEEDGARRMSHAEGLGWDGSGAEGDVHLDWVHTPGRCPHQVSVENLEPKVGRVYRTKV